MFQKINEVKCVSGLAFTVAGPLDCPCTTLRCTSQMVSGEDTACHHPTSFNIFTSGNTFCARCNRSHFFISESHWFLTTIFGLISGQHMVIFGSILWETTTLDLGQNYCIPKMTMATFFPAQNRRCWSSFHHHILTYCPDFYMIFKFSTFKNKKLNVPVF